MTNTVPALTSAVLYHMLWRERGAASRLSVGGAGARLRGLVSFRPRQTASTRLAGPALRLKLSLTNNNISPGKLNISHKMINIIFRKRDISVADLNIYTIKK